MALGVLVLCPAMAYADDNLETAQTYRLDALADQVSSQHYRVIAGDGETASQLFVINAYDPTIGMATPDAAAISLVPGGGMGTAEIPVSVYSGLMGGYAVLYEFANSDLVCEMSYIIPTIGQEGDIMGNTWGQNKAELASGEGGGLEMPEVWKPANTSLEYLALTYSPSALPFDKYGMMLAAKANMTTTACEYTNTLNITAIPAP